MAEIAHTVAETANDSRPLFTRAFGLRLALWYATLFVVGSLAIVFLTYYLTAASLAQRDRQIINAKLGQYSSVYASGGIQALADTVRAEQRVAPERLYVRVANRGEEALVLSMPEGWDPATLETASAHLLDGTLVEVGKSTEARDDLLARFRAALGLVTLSIVVIALSGGLLATRTAMQPIRRLADAVRRIIRTGRTDARVPLEGTGDALDELTDLFNAMLDTIEGLVTAMRGALDNVSHDLRTPLTHLRGAAELALAAPPDLDRCREALADCVEESDRVLVMLNTLMDISEAESGTLHLQREPVSLRQVVDRAVDLYRDVADAKGVTLTVADRAAAGRFAAGSARSVSDGASADARAVAAARGDPADADLIVSGDRTRLEQVAANLIDNAVKYTPPGGRVDAEIVRDDGRALLRVCDTGAGIPPHEMPRIWDRLFRGDTSRTERGLGLGLSLVKAIVEAHGGTVDVTSTRGSGSTFTVSLPLLSDP
ncbi:MAG TPA: HAMP domain-containing sensor histidine kinase [Vicinamibacterales bacterium]|nr:HAMP domain-containing sensor histidine kinase [Vicinamibacterales bacterium]